MATDSEEAATPLGGGSIAVVLGDRRLTFPPDKPVVLGRGSDADVVIEDPTVGRHHATLEYADGGWSLLDAGSQNGTWIDGQRVERVAIAGTVTLRVGATDGGTVITVAQAGADLAQPGSGGAATDVPATDVPATDVPATDVAAALEEPTTCLPVSTEPAAPAAPALASRREETIRVVGLTDVTRLAEPQAPAASPSPPPLLQPSPGPGGARRPARPPGDLPVLVVRSAGVQHLFPVGVPVRIGRDPALEVVSTNPLVSRSQHGRLTSDRAGATYTDSSARGTYLNGRRLTKPFRITESVTLHLGDPSTGEELGVTPPLSIAQIERNRRRRTTRRRVKIIGVVAVVVLGSIGAGVVVAVNGHGSASHNAAGLPPASLARAEAATVRLLTGTPTDATSSGSGTIITPDGLILTNGHVAEPQALGEAVAQSVPGRQLDPNPPFLTVELTSTGSAAVVARYRAKPVAVDGYLDLALIQIDSDAAGRPVDRASLHLPFLRLGDVSKLQLGQPVTVLGFPGVSQSDSLSVTSGVISTFIPDPLKHNPDPRFELETTARVAHGNSGGAAINNAGELVGVPSLTVPGEGTDISWRLRPVSLAKPLMTIARSGSGAAYKTPWLVAATGNEQAQVAGWATTEQGACRGTNQVAPGPTAIAVGFDVSSIPAGLDLAVVAVMPGGHVYRTLSLQLPQISYMGGNCAVFELFAQEIGQRSFPDGIYRVQLLGGPDLHIISNPATDLVGPPSSNGGA